ncbi:carbamoyl phosphate synthase small subunit [Cytobacillus purgationiresistens]|uniref:Carbamoyl phosphate synthase small chain n=1 Tax=Cytobacillus purgationiresistens TaxID=863449 RepID=A0ABU0ADF5_9BACI|nr:carbamoyl phosphate synthase small subunit [Cytobacillus purgationiresistens]MDQ0268761.1 carbamoyl-phosphate synthase small subunit [Cytobacillus purgationiresistens]
MEGYLHLQSGHSYEGEWLSEPPKKNIEGEIVFFTGMTGYQEVLTDPSYKDQIIVFTYPLIGNYGINESDFESKKPHVAGVIVYEGSEKPSHYQSAYSLKEYLNKWDVPLMGHMDTRAIVKKIRSEGSMPAVMSSDPSFNAKEIVLQKDEKVYKVSSTKHETYGSGDTHIVLYDFGSKKSIIDSLVKRNCCVTSVPYHTSFDEINSLNPDGIVLSNGPGDPKELVNYLFNIKRVLETYPTLGICLGHQLSVLAMGGNTKKLSFGHRGANHPIADLEKGTVMMSSQNHSYVVDEASLFGTGFIKRYVNLHDQSIEGLMHETFKIQTVQFHPEAHPGPGDTNYVFDEFIMMITEEKRRVRAYA